MKINYFKDIKTQMDASKDPTYLINLQSGLYDQQFLFASRSDLSDKELIKLNDEFEFLNDLLNKKITKYSIT